MTLPRYVVALYFCADHAFLWFAHHVRIVSVMGAHMFIQTR